jgi:hypothetical protein
MIRGLDNTGTAIAASQSRKVGTLLGCSISSGLDLGDQQKHPSQQESRKMEVSFFQLVFDTVVIK